MADENITTKIGIDISQFKRGLQDASRQIKLANAEFQKASAGMDKWSDSAEGISAKIKQLESILDAENKKLAIQKARLAEVEKEQGANSAGADELRIAIAKQEAEIAKTQKSLGYFKNQLEAVNKAEKDGKSALSQLNGTISEQENKLKALKNKYANVVLEQGKNSKEARALGKEIEKLSSDLNNNKDKLNDASSSADKYDKSIKEAGNDTETAGEQAENAGNGGFTVLKGIMANLASQAITSVISGIKNLTGELVNMGKQAIQSYAEYEQLKGGIETMFEDLSYDVELNAKNAFRTTGMSANEYLNTVMGFSASLNQSLTKTEGNIARSADVANDIINDMADNSSKMGTDMQAIQNAYAGFAKGQFNMLDNLKLGYGGSQAEMKRLLADAEKLSGKKFKLDNFADIAEAIHVIQEEMGIAGNASLEASDTISGSLGAMKASWQNLLTGLGSGEDVDLLISNFTNSLVTFLGNVTPIVKNVINGLSQLITALGTEILPELFSAIEPELPGLLEALLSAITSLFETGVPALIGLINDQLPTILQALTQILLTIVNSLIDQLPQTLEMLINSAVMIIETLIDNFPVDKFIEIIPKIIDVLMNALPQLQDAGFKLLMALIDALPKVLDMLIKELPKIIQTLLQFFNKNMSKMLQAGYKFLMAIVNALPKVLSMLAKELPNIIKAIVDFINENLPTLLQVAVELFKQIINAIPVFLQELLPQLPTIIHTIVDCLVQNIPLILDASIQLFYAIIEALPIIAQALIPEIGNLVGTICHELIMNAPQLIISALKFFWVIISDVLPKLILALGDVGAEFIDTIVEKFIKPLIDFFSEGWKAVMDVFKDVGKFFLDGFKLAWDNITGVFKDIGSWFGDRWQDIVDVFTEAPRWFYRKFLNVLFYIKKPFEVIGSWFGDRWNDITNVFKDVASWFSGVFQEASDAIKEIWQGVVDFFDWVYKKIKWIFGVGSAIDIGDLEAKLENYTNTASAGANVPQLASGGVLGKGQIGLLEGNGSEAVVPLDQNKKWINATARDMRKALEGYGMISSVGGSNVVNYNFTQNNTSPTPLNRLEIYRQTQNQIDYYMGV